jgi:cardiolipin synthase
MTDDATLAAAIEDVATRLPAGQVDTLARHVAPMRSPTPAGRAAVASAVPTAPFKATVGALWDAWSLHPETDGQAVSLALRAAARTAETLRAVQSTEIVWTGPASAHVPVRISAQVLVDLITNAQRELVVVSFAAYKVPDVHAALRAAADRGVDIRLVLETEKDSGGRLSHDAAEAFTSLGASASFWRWPEDRRPDGGAAMHAKAAVADRHVALVTSANLTGAALALNMELGLLVTGGPVPERLADHFRALMADGTLKLVTGQ